MNMLEDITEEIIKMHPELGARITDYDYNVYCSPRVLEEFIDAVVAKGFIIPEVLRYGIPKEAKISTFHIPNIGLIRFHPLLVNGYRIEHTKT